MKLHTTYCIVVSLSLLMVLLSQAQTPLSTTLASERPDSISQCLSEISRQGKLLYAYDYVCRVGSDEVMSRRPDSGRLGMFLAYGDSSGWSVGFGRLSSRGEYFELAYEARCSGALTYRGLKMYVPAERDSSRFLPLAKAVRTVLRVFSPRAKKYKYNYALLPGDPHCVDVYLYPAQADPGVYPLGGDERYTVSLSSDEITGLQYLHKSVIEYSVPSDTVNASASFSSAILTKLPVATDVLFTLLRQPRMPHFVAVNETTLYRINTDGTIRVLNHFPEADRQD